MAMYIVPLRVYSPALSLRASHVVIRRRSPLAAQCAESAEIYEQAVVEHRTW